MRRLAFVFLATLIVGLSSAGPAQGYWALFHRPHHLPHPQGHFFHHKATPGAVAPAATPGQIIGAIHLGREILGILFPNPNQGGNNGGGNNTTPAPEPTVGADVTAKITANEAAINGVVDKTNALLAKVRANDDTRFNTTNLPDVSKVGGGGGDAGGGTPPFGIGPAGTPAGTPKPKAGFATPPVAPAAPPIPPAAKTTTTTTITTTTTTSK